MKSKFLALAAVWSLCSFYGMTQESSAPTLLSLDDALQIALSESPTVKIADKEVERKQYAKKEVIGGLMPNINASGQYTHAIKIQRVNLGGNEFEMGTKNQYTLGAQLNIPIIAPALWKNIQLSEVDIQRSIEAANASRESMILEVKDAYYNILLAENSLEVIQKNYDQAVVNFNNVKSRLEQGVSSEYDVIRSEVQVRNLEPNVIQAESGVLLAYIKLKSLLGFDTSQNIKINGNLTEYESKIYETALNIDTLVVNNNSTMRKLALEEKYMLKLLSVQKMAHIPTLSGTAQFSYMAMNDDFNFCQYKFNPSANVGLTLQIPIFDGLARFRKTKQTRISLESLKLQTIDAERSIKLQVQNFTDNMNKAIKQIESNKKGISLAEKGYSIARTKYETGAGSFIEMNDADVALLQAKLSYNQAIYNYLYAKIQLENVLGLNHQ